MMIPWLIVNMIGIVLLGIAVLGMMALVGLVAAGNGQMGAALPIGLVGK